MLVAAHLNPIDRLVQQLPRYRNARKAASYGAMASDDLTIMMPMFVAATPEETRKWAEPAVRSYAHSLAGILDSAAAALPEGSDRARAQVLAERARATTYDDMNQGGMAIFGTPEECLERLGKVRSMLDPGRVIAWFDFMGAIPHERVMGSMELFSSKVLPHV